MKITYELDESKTHYLNVDLDVWSRTLLEPLAKALQPRLSVLYVGGERRRHEAHFELPGGPPERDAEKTVLGLTRVVERLPPVAQRLWRQATVREFNVGVQAAAEPYAFELRLSANAVEAAARVGAAMVFTVYAPQPAKALRRPERRSVARKSSTGSRQR